MDRDKLKEQIRQAISAKHSCKNNLCDERSYDRCICESDAEAALAAVEDAGISMCQVPPGIKGETVSREGALQSGAGGDALDRGLPRHFSLHFCANKNGFLQVYSEDVPEFYISGNVDHVVASDIEPVLSRILWENYGTTIAGFCQRQARSEIEEAQRADTMPLTSGETPDTNNQDADNGK